MRVTGGKSQPPNVPRTRHVAEFARSGGCQNHDVAQPDTKVVRVSLNATVKRRYRWSNVGGDEHVTYYAATFVAAAPNSPSTRRR